MSKELRIKRGDIELAISFSDKDELVQGLSDYEVIVNTIKERLGVSFEPIKKVRKGLEGIVEFDNDRMVLCKAPKTKADKICLVLYAIGADGATPEEISMISLVQNPSQKVLHDKFYKKFFRKLQNGKYVLSDVGLSHVSDKILPDLRGESNNAAD